MSGDKELDLGPIEERVRHLPKVKLELVTDEREMGDSHYWTAEVKDEKGNTIADITDDCWDYGELFANAPTDIAALVAEVRRLRSIIQQTEMADDIIYKNYKRLMTQLPQCPEHGECVPYAIDWLKDLKTKNPGLVS
jgi:hypothetical protein